MLQFDCKEEASALFQLVVVFFQENSGYKSCAATKVKSENRVVGARIEKRQKPMTSGRSTANLYP